jgi:hypothetical protein
VAGIAGAAPNAPRELPPDAPVDPQLEMIRPAVSRPRMRALSTAVGTVAHPYRAHPGHGPGLPAAGGEVRCRAREGGRATRE